MIKAVIFDCFGVLIEDSLKAIREKLDTKDREDIESLLFACHRGLITAEESSAQIARILGLNSHEYRQVITAGEVKNQPLMDYILEIKKSYKTAMLSNISIGGLKSRFTDEELTKHFDVVVASGEIGYAKPEAQAYEIVAERLGVRLEECVFTDDIDRYCEAARGVGMQAFTYESFEKTKQALMHLLG